MSTIERAAAEVGAVTKSAPRNRRVTSRGRSALAWAIAGIAAFAARNASAQAEPPPPSTVAPPTASAAPPPATSATVSAPTLATDPPRESGTTSAPPSAEPPPVSETPIDVVPESLPGSSERAQAKAVKGGGFIDTRLTWTFGDDDVLHRTGETQPLSPLASIGDRPQYRLFFDNLNSRFAGRENLTHLVMYSRLPGFVPNLTTEAALVLRFDLAALASQNGNLNQALYDSGSYLRLFYKTGAPEKEGVSFVFYPLDTDRFRLGYLYDISWGGTNAAQNQSIFPRLVGSSPGAKVQYDGPSGFYVFGGFKTASIVQVQRILTPSTNTGNEVESVRVAETNYGFLGGAGVDLGKLFHVDAGGGYFQQGRFDLPDLQPAPNTDAQAPQVFTYGASARLVLHQGMPAPQSVDFLLYQNDPQAPMQLFKLEKFRPDEFAYALSLEGSILEQNLHNSDPNVTGATKLQAAHAAALSGIMKAGYARFGFSAILRDVPFILRNQPSFVPFDAISPQATTQDEMFFAGSFDYYLQKLHLRPGVGAGLQLPATYATQYNDPLSGAAGRTVVVRSQGNLSILPLNESRRPIFQGRVSLRWDLSEMMAAVGWLQLVHDPNGTLVTRDTTSGTVNLRTFQASDFFGFGLTLQARY